MLAARVSDLLRAHTACNVLYTARALIGFVINFLRVYGSFTRVLSSARYVISAYNRTTNEYVYRGTAVSGAVIVD